MENHYFTIRTLLLLYLSAMFAAASAQQVSQDEAARIASQFLSAQNQGSRAKKAAPDALKLVYTEPSAKDKTPNLYVFNMEGGGFAIVSADERTGSQILGYSFDNNFSAKGMPDNVKFWLGEYSRQIDFIKTHQPEVSESKRRGGLKMEEGDPVAPTITNIVVAPLLSTTWGQDAPYNGMTPTLSGEHTRTGCVATAMAQIMNYWEWPEKGTGYHRYFWKTGMPDVESRFEDHTYAWDKMTDSYNNESSSDAINAVAQLMFDCGVAVEMDYGLTASGAYDDDVVSALKDYFNYTSNLSLKHQSDYATKEEWNNILTNELDFSRPVYYSADDATPNDEDGHAFVLDGYGTIDNEIYFHINWGWDGFDGYGTKTANGYFAMNAFNTQYHNTGEIDCYNLNSIAIVNIYPASSDEFEFNDDLEAGWDAEGNWYDEEDFGFGQWEDNVAYYNNPTYLTLTRQQNKTYKDVYRVNIKNWEKNVPESTGTTTVYNQQDDKSNRSLVFYWNSVTNDCYLPTQNTGLIKSNTSTADFGPQFYGDLSFLDHETIFGKYNPTNGVFNLNFYSEYLYATYRYKSKTKDTYVASNKVNPMLIDNYDTEEFLDLLGNLQHNSVYESENNDTTYTFTIKKTPGATYDSYEYKFTPKALKQGGTVPANTNYFIYTLQDMPSTATLTLYLPEPKGLYLGNFTEDTDEQTGEYTGTAKQEAGIIKSVSANYRIGLMPVNENTTNAGIVSFAKSLTGTVYSTTEGTLDPLISLDIPEEGAYYVVAAYYDDEDGTQFASYEYLPVFYSSSDKWETLTYQSSDYLTAYDNESNPYNYNYQEDIVGCLYSSAKPSKYIVTVQQYKGGDLIKNTKDRIFRIKNPYGICYDKNHERTNVNYDEDEDVGNEEDYPPYRTDVYLYLYVDAQNNVSFYPDCFEYQPLGIDWNCGEMMVKQNDVGSIDNNSAIKFGQDALYLMEYYDEEYAQDVNSDAGSLFLLQLPQNAKYYLTLVDNQPYTDNEGSTEYYKGAYYSRELGINNDWGTLMLPFDFNTNKIEGFEFYKLTIATTELLTFSKYDGENVTVAANTPIVFKRTVPTKSLEVFEESNSGCLTISSCNGINDGEAVDDWTFVGVYYNSTDEGNEDNAITASSENPRLEQCYFFEGNEIWNVTARMDLYQYRGYFRYDGTSNLAKRIPVRFNDEEYTSLDALFNGEQPVKKYGKGRFNLQGQAVGKDYKGVVIEDGRKKIRF